MLFLKHYTLKTTNLSLTMVKSILDYKRQFISKQYGPPTVQVQKPMIHKADTIAKSTWKDHPIITSTAIGFTYHCHRTDCLPSYKTFV